MSPPAVSLFAPQLRTFSLNLLRGDTVRVNHLESPLRSPAPASTEGRARTRSTATAAAAAPASPAPTASTRSTSATRSPASTAACARTPWSPSAAPAPKASLGAAARCEPRPRHSHLTRCGTNQSSRLDVLFYDPVQPDSSQLVQVVSLPERRSLPPQGRLLRVRVLQRLVGAPLRRPPGLL